MKQIRLKRREWEFDPDSPIGEAGGFGAVYAGRGEQFAAVAVKQLHITADAAAHRELRIVDELMQRPLTHVIPMLDDGQDAESDLYYVVMARAERSLQEEISRVGACAELESVSILRQIAAGLAEVRDIVHRDLKPANVLLHDGNWKLADFGIARFVEESTSIHTLKDFLSAPYAAPEQWLDAHATAATDIYALGCMAYAVLTGLPPFQGPTHEDYREQHLHMAPPPLKTQNARLRMLVAIMLRKMPESRPNIDRVIQQLDDIASEEARGTQAKGLRELAQAGAMAAEASLRSDAAQMAYETQQLKRKELAGEAFRVLEEVSATLFQCIETAVSDAAQRIDSSLIDLLLVKFGDATLRIEKLLHGYPVPQNSFPNSGWDVIAGANIHVAQSGERAYQWGASLWYTNMGHGEEYRWWEVMYMWHPLLKTHPYTNEPFALDTMTEADAAAGPSMGRIALAAKPRPVDDENVDDFCNRWAALLARAYNGQLECPRELPLY